jgi:hypothetical protein
VASHGDNQEDRKWGRQKLDAPAAKQTAGSQFTEVKMQSDSQLGVVSIELITTYQMKPPTVHGWLSW